MRQYGIDIAPDADPPLIDSEQMSVASSRAPAAPADWEARYRRMVLQERAFDYLVGFFLSYYRSFSTPTSAAALVASGEIIRRPDKRSYDTAIIIMEIIANGFDSERGRAAVDILNRAHKHVRAENDEFLYVLLTLVIVPTRWIDAHGRTPSTQAELASAMAFYRELASRMHIRDVPETFDDAVRFYDEFEATRVEHTDDTDLLMNATVAVLAKQLPLPLRPLTRSFLSVLIDDPRMVRVLGLEPASPALARVTFTVLAIRAKLPQPKQSFFFPGRSGRRVYPGGYVMDDLGPSA